MMSSSRRNTLLSFSNQCDGSRLRLCCVLFFLTKKHTIACDNERSTRHYLLNFNCFERDKITNELMADVFVTIL